MSGPKPELPVSTGNAVLDEFHAVLNELPPHLRGEIEHPPRTIKEANLQVQAVLGSWVMAKQRVDSRQLADVIAIPIQPTETFLDQAMSM